MNDIITMSQAGQSKIIAEAWLSRGCQKMYTHFKNGKNCIKIVIIYISRRMRWVGHVARMGEERGAHRVLVGKPERKRPLGRPTRRCQNNIRMDLQVGLGRGGWIESAQDKDRWLALESMGP
jgi:hypothetical protein